MNIALGGEGGWDKYNSDSNIQKAKWVKSYQKQKYLAETDSEWCERRKIKKSNSLKKAYENGTRQVKINPLAFLGKHHTEKSKQKIGDANKKMTGSKNSNFGTIWITDGTNNKKIKKFDIIPDGWYKGRTM